MVLFSTQNAVELSVTMVVGGWGYSISSKAVFMGAHFLLFWKSLPILDSIADAKTFFVMAHLTCTALWMGGMFWVGGLSKT